MSRSTEVFASGFTDAVEGPACDLRGNVYAVNFATRGTIGRVSADGVGQVWHVLPDGSEGCGMVFGPDGRLSVADWRLHRILRMDTRTGTEAVHCVEPQMSQPNDLAICADGTIFASDPDWSAGTGKLWRIDPDGSVVLLESNMGTTNGIEVSPDESTLYVNESIQRRVWAYELEGRTPKAKRLLARFSDHLLDGMRCDVEGNLFVTRPGAGEVQVFDPTGRKAGCIRTHGRGCTNVAFGGRDGRTLFVTVADTGCIERTRTPIPGRSHGLLARWAAERGAES